MYVSEYVETRFDFPDLREEPRATKIEIEVA
jgi:hypothetical protein